MQKALGIPIYACHSRKNHASTDRGIRWSGCSLDLPLGSEIFWVPSRLEPLEGTRSPVFQNGPPVHSEFEPSKVPKIPRRFEPNFSKVADICEIRTYEQECWSDFTHAFVDSRLCIWILKWDCWTWEGAQIRLLPVSLKFLELHLTPPEPLRRKRL